MDSILQEVLAILQYTTNLVMEAPPGTGRTTGVPPAILGLVHDEVLRWLPMDIETRWTPVPGGTWPVSWRDRQAERKCHNVATMESNRRRS